MMTMLQHPQILGTALAQTSIVQVFPKPGTRLIKAEIKKLAREKVRYDPPGGSALVVIDSKQIPSEKGIYMVAVTWIVCAPPVGGKNVG